MKLLHTGFDQMAGNGRVAQPKVGMALRRCLSEKYTARLYQYPLRGTLIGQHLAVQMIRPLDPGCGAALRRHDVKLWQIPRKRAGQQSTPFSVGDVQFADERVMVTLRNEKTCGVRVVGRPMPHDQAPQRTKLPYQVGGSHDVANPKCVNQRF